MECDDLPLMVLIVWWPLVGPFNVCMRQVCFGGNERRFQQLRPAFWYLRGSAEGGPILISLLLLVNVN